jgi:hypothetical protein
MFRPDKTMKNIKLNALVFEMLLELCKKDRKTPEAFIETTIKNLYSRMK